MASLTEIVCPRCKELRLVLMEDNSCVDAHCDSCKICVDAMNKTNVVAKRTVWTDYVKLVSNG